MPFDSFELIRLHPTHDFGEFSCGDNEGEKDLNDFLLTSSKSYQKELLAVTYLLVNKQETIAFFSLANDKISIKDHESTKSAWRRLTGSNIHYLKRRESYPAMKIGRLAVSHKYKKQGIGQAILNYLKQHFIDNNRTGCKFITVDAYKDSLGFYEKNGFKYITTSDLKSDTRLMFFDLTLIYNAIQP